MPTPYTTQDLITNAFYLSQIVARGLQTVTQDQINDGLWRLNGFIAMKGAQTKLVPYYKEVQGNFITDQEMYFIPGLTEIETLVFYLPDSNGNNAVRFSMREETRFDYFATGRVEGIDALPYQWHLERVYGGANLYVYYLPQQDYAYTMLGKFELAPVQLNQILSVTYDQFYLEYMLYGLAIYLCEFYDVVPSGSLMRQYHDFEFQLSTLSRMDLTVRKLECFAKGSGIQYADANIGRGFRPTT